MSFPALQLEGNSPENGVGAGGSLSPKPPTRSLGTRPPAGPLAGQKHSGAPLPLGEKEDTAPLSLQPVEKNKL